MTQYRQLELFPCREEAANMSFEWWLQDVEDILYAYTGLPLKALYRDKPKWLIAISKMGWGGEVNLKERYKLKYSPLNTVKDILKLILVYHFENPSHAQYLGVKDIWDESIEQTLTRWESFKVELHGKVLHETIILDQQEYYGELDFPTPYLLEERATKLDRIQKASGLRPYCCIQPNALIKGE